MKTRLTAVLLLSALFLTACGSSEPVETAAPDSSSAPENTGMSYDPEVPETDFGGYTFTFAVRGDGSGSGKWHSTDIFADSINGDVLNDAVYQRTSFIEETYNVKFDLMWCGETSTAITGSAMSQAVTKQIMAGDDTIDAILSSPYDTVGYLMNGYLIDLNSVEYLNLDKPWWDQNVNESLSFNGKIFFTTGEMTIIDNKCAYAMLFSKNVVDMYKLESPYDVVKSGRWTLDHMITDAKTVSADLNGSGEADENDRYGVEAWQDACFGFIHSTGSRFGVLNDKGEPELTFYNERMVNSWEKLIDFMQTDNCLALKPGDDALNKIGGSQEINDTLRVLLETDRALYAFATINTILALRQSNADFGVIPMPKYDEAQEHYYSTSHGYATTMLSIPVTVSDPSRSGLILEAFAAKSMELVTPAFYDVTLTGKSIRDDESAEMLDIIFGGKVYDIGYFYQWGNLTNLAMNAFNAKDKNIASLWEGAKTAAEQGVADAQKVFGTLE